MLQDPIQTLSRCLEHALSKGMGYVPRDAKTTREHHPDEIEVAGMFPQLWGSTALGFGGVGGSAMTEAYTVALRSRVTGEVCVYFGGRFAYRIEHPTPCLVEDIAAQGLAPIYEAVKYERRHVRRAAS